MGVSRAAARLRYLRLTLIFLFVAVMALKPATMRGAGALNNGENHSDTISAAGEVDVWTFTAAVGDSIVLRIGEVGPDTPFVPWIRLFRPDDVLIGNQAGTLAAEIETTATQAGTYTVHVASNDVGNNDTGTYTLTLAKTGAFTTTPGDQGGPITLGANHTGAIHVGDLDMWSFSATAGDAIVLRIGEVGADTAFTPWIRLKSPTGQNLGSQASTLADEIEATATVTGTYTIIVATNDAGFDASGDYTLTVTTSAGPLTVSPGDQGGTMTNGSNHTGSIFVGDVDSWTFAATAGESIVLRIGEVGSDTAFVPWIRLKSPTGQNLGSQAPNPMAAEIEATATVTGTYTVIVTTNDVGLDATGDYTLTLAKTGEPFTISGGDEGGPVTLGANHPGSIHVGDLDMWSFTATAGDSIILRIGEVGADTAFVPWIRLKSPTGQNLGSQAPNPMAAEIEATASVTGTYTVIVTTNDTGFDALGNYTLTVMTSAGPLTVSNGDQGGPMTNGSNHTGAMFVGDVDNWTFTATAGESITLRIGEVGADSPFIPWIRLKSPTGQNLGSQGAGVLANEIEATATVTGTYTVVVATADIGLDATGNYTLTLAKTGSSFTISGGDEGGPATNGANHTGTLHVGDLDVWTFTATAGEAITIGIGEVGGDTAFNPWIRLKSPTGQNLGSQANTLAEQIEATAGVTGTYTVIVATGDVGIDATGNYTLTIANVPRAFVTSGGDQGGALTLGQGIGTIHIGDLDMWTFQAYSGDPLVIQVSETGSPSPDFAPWIRLKSPTGQNLGSTAGATNATINIGAPATGIYTVIVSSGDAGVKGFGDYNLLVSGNSTNMIKNGQFTQGETNWNFFGSPTPNNNVHQITGGVAEFYRIDPPPNTFNSAAAFQNTGVNLPDQAPIRAQFDIANTSSVRKRVSVLAVDLDFSDITVCTFFLEPNAPMRTYIMRTHTTKAWSNASLYFYAASAGSNGGFYQIDNVSMTFVPEQAANRTDCVDPTTPAPTVGADGPNLIGNGDFSTGDTPPWFTAFNISTQVVGGVLRFNKPDNTIPSGVIGQATGQPMTAGQFLTATFQLGNLSNVRKRVTLLLNDSDFQDLSACTFWLAPNQPLGTYAFRMYTTKVWSGAMLHVYPATGDSFPWVLLDNVTLQRTPSANIVGTECLEPGAVGGEAIGEEARSASVDLRVPESAQAGAAAGISSESAPIEIIAAGPGIHTLSIADAIDLRGTGNAQLTLESWLTSASSQGAVQVSADGETWTTVGDAAASEGWTAMQIDVSGFAGQVIRVRFVLNAAPPAEGAEPAAWRIRNLRIAK